MIRWRLILAALVSAVLALGGQAMASGSSPLTMVRSLQFVQDAVIRGDHSAIEMQRHLLRLIDERLRAADSAVFETQANVDAAIIYSLSGGNPATLPLLADRHPDAGFDPELLELLEVHLAGRGQAVFEPMRAILPNFRGSRIEPYLTLVTANAAAGASPKDAMVLFDWARLLSPGSIIEEAALRRSIDLALDLGLVEEGLVRAERYARRFLHSPYAGQFADLFVELVIAHPDDIEAERIAETLAFMDVDRQRSVYLRIARRAAIDGNRALAVHAASAVESLGEPNEKVKALADLYAGVATVPGEHPMEAAQSVAAIDALDLSERDRALRSAAASIAAAVTREPRPEVLDALPAPDEPEAAPDTTAETAEGAAAFEGFVEERRQVLERIDALLEESQ